MRRENNVRPPWKKLQNPSVKMLTGFWHRFWTTIPTLAAIVSQVSLPWRFCFELETTALTIFVRKRLVYIHRILCC